jgi:hypothetical protein
LDALGILGEREKHLKHQTAELQKKLKETQARVKEAKEEGRKGEQARTRRLLKGKDRDIQRLKERLRQVQRGSTPQTEGLEFEDKLTERLKREFPEDKVDHTGRGGDVLHTVRFSKKPAGIIIYECKRSPRIQGEHVRQAFRAKQERHADFAVLVTTGRKQGFAGLARMGGVIVVAPLGAIPLADLLRRHLIEMLRAKVTKEERALIAERLMEYLASPQFKNPIEEVVERTEALQGLLLDEAKAHARTWQKRWDHYQIIHWDTSRIQANVQLVLQGKEPKTILRPRILSLEVPRLRQLPPPREQPAN